MRMAKDTKKGSGLGLAATLIGAAAAGFFLYGPKGKENRVKVKAWTLKAKAEVLEQFEKYKEVTDETYEQVVDKVTARYAKMKNVGEEEADKLNRELKKHWRAIKKAATEDTQKGVKAAKKSAKKAVSTEE
jgi:gas vesicle protein